ncbi:ArnT family glycosyltransferase [Planctomicrobium sp. SH668]|uniref:ArnT family glycosyltransferase n=1 Tax=Planctomicrobium sp. SH668 TaxID=3448126 RepID=UPI003F5C314B
MIDSSVSRQFPRALLLILLIALTLRVLAACGLQYLLDFHWHRSFLIEGDAEGYWQLAQKIVAGDSYSIHEPPRYAERMPGFPALLAIPVALFGPKLFAARLFLAVVGTFACWQVYRLGRNLFNERVGLIAALLASISPVLIVFTETILSETAFGVTLLWSLLAGHKLFQLLNAKSVQLPLVLIQSAITGIAIAAGVMMRPSWILAAPILASLLIITAPHRLKSVIAGGVVVAAMVLSLLPWGVRNQQVTGHFTLTTFWMGPSLYDGLNPEANGDSDMRFFDRDQLMSRMDEYEVDQYYRKAAWQFARENPGRALHLAWLKTLRYWSPWPNAAQFNQWWGKFIISLFSLPMITFAVWGTARLFTGFDSDSQRITNPQVLGRIWTMAILAGPVFYFALIHLFFVSSLRYRLPAEYPLLVLTALGISQVLNSGRVQKG